MMKTIEEREALFKKILDICFFIHSEYGPGMFESFYEAVLCYELEKCGIACRRQLNVAALHDGKDMGLAYRMDVLVEDEILVELKSKESRKSKVHKI